MSAKQPFNVINDENETCRVARVRYGRPCSLRSAVARAGSYSHSIAPFDPTWNPPGGARRSGRGATAVTDARLRPATGTAVTVTEHKNDLVIFITVAVGARAPAGGWVKNRASGAASFRHRRSRHVTPTAGPGAAAA